MIRRRQESSYRVRSYPANAVEVAINMDLALLPTPSRIVLEFDRCAMTDAPHRMMALSPVYCLKALSVVITE